MADSPNPSSAMLLFFIFTTIYSVMQYNATKTYAGTDAGADKNESAGKMYFMIYILAVVIGQFFVNLQLTTSMCGSPNYSTAAMCTFFPWGFIFGILLLFLNMFPGWLAPFSNTFGYGVALAAGLNDTMVDILKPQSKDQRRSEGEQLSSQAEEALEHIYADRSLLINEITSDNFDNFWNNMSGLFRKNVSNNISLKSSLYSFVVLKEIVSEYIWYILAGMLITSVSFNYIAGTACNVSAAEMQARHEDYEKELKAAQDDAKAKSDNQRVYETHE